MSLSRNLPNLGKGLSRHVCAVGQTNDASQRRGITDLSAMRRGRGGRSSFSGIVTTVFGASGFMGRYVANRLGKTGTQMIFPYRGDHYEVRHLKVAGDLGQILFMPYHLCDEESIRKAVKHSHCVINLVGRDWETRNFTFDQVHVEGAERLARISKEMGVRKFIHLSALNCDREHEGYIIEGGSNYLRSKGLGEQAVKAEFPEATIMRPSDVYGQEDRFLRYYIGLWRHQGMGMPLPKGGKDIWKQPVHVSDVAQAIAAAVKAPEAIGTTYEIVGPRRYELGELLQWFHRVMRKDKLGYMTYDMKWDPLIKMKAKITEKGCPSWPVNYLTTDKLEREAVTDVVAGLPGLLDLGITPTLMEDRIEWELKPWRANRYYEEEVGEFAPPTPPNYIQAM